MHNKEQNLLSFPTLFSLFPPKTRSSDLIKKKLMATLKIIKQKSCHMPCPLLSGKALHSLVYSDARSITKNLPGRAMIKPVRPCKLLGNKPCHGRFPPPGRGSVYSFQQSPDQVGTAMGNPPGYRFQAFLFQQGIDPLPEHDRFFLADKKSTAGRRPLRQQIPRYLNMGMNHIVDVCDIHPVGP
jgi:hypothetical protein